MRQAGRSLEDQQGSKGPDDERDDTQDVLLAGIRAAPDVERGLDNVERGRPNVTCSAESLLGLEYGVPALSLMQCCVTFLSLPSRCHDNHCKIISSPISFRCRQYILKLMMGVRGVVCEEHYKAGNRCGYRIELQGEPTIYHANGLEGQQQETKPPLLHNLSLPS